MNKILKALERKEKITVLYHGKAKGVILPVGYKNNKKIKDQAFFGMLSDEMKPVKEIMDDVRE